MTAYEYYQKCLALLPRLAVAMYRRLHKQDDMFERRFMCPKKKKRLTEKEIGLFIWDIVDCIFICVGDRYHIMLKMHQKWEARFKELFGKPCPQRPTKKKKK